jgi:hypothetical protein
MKKIWIPILIIFIAVIFAWLLWPRGTTVIKFVKCPPPNEDTKAMVEEKQYDVKKGGKVRFVNKSEVPITLKFQSCDLLEGDPQQIDLGLGEEEEYKVKPNAADQECNTILEPDCRQAGPIIIPEP